jgi:hypothetical protein
LPDPLLQATRCGPQAVATAVAKSWCEVRVPPRMGSGMGIGWSAVLVKGTVYHLRLPPLEVSLSAG